MHLKKPKKYLRLEWLGLLNLAVVLLVLITGMSLGYTLLSDANKQVTVSNNLDSSTFSQTSDYLDSTPTIIYLQRLNSEVIHTKHQLNLSMLDPDHIEELTDNIERLSALATELDAHSTRLPAANLHESLMVLIDISREAQSASGYNDLHQLYQDTEDPINYISAIITDTNKVMQSNSDELRLKTKNNLQLAS